MQLKIKKLNPNVKLPEYATDGSVGLDLCAFLENEPNKEITLHPYKSSDFPNLHPIPTGISIELPTGYEAQIRARSGLSTKHGLTLINGIGTIDLDYRGEIKIPIINLGNLPYTIKHGERIAQMVIIPILKPKIIETDTLSNTTRGEGGFGSTGKH